MKDLSAAGRYAAIAFVCVLALHMISTAISIPLDFDESFNLQVPLNLYLAGVYRTWYNGYHEFNYLITTGPAVLFPVFLSFLAGSSAGFVKARLVTCLFSLVFIGVISRPLFRRESGGKGVMYGAALLVLVSSVPEFVTLSCEVLGEVPGMALIAAGYWLFADERPSRAVLAGVLLALAVLSKLIFLMALAPVAMVLLIDAAASRSYRGQAVRAGYFLYGFAAPLALWQVFKISSLGIEGYLQGLKLFSRFFGSVTRGSGPGLVERALTVPGLRLSKLAAGINMAGPAGYIFLALLVLAAALVAYSSVRGRKPERFSLMVMAYGILHTVWWIFLNIADYYRHLFPGLLLLLCGTVLALYDVSRDRTRVGTAAAVLFAAVFFLFASFNLPVFARGLAGGFTFVPSKGLLEQEAYASKVSELAGQGYLFYGYEWLQSPELSFLAGTRFFSIYDSRSLSYIAKRRGILVVSRYNLDKDPKMTMDALAAFTDVGPAELDGAGFPAETPYVFAAVTHVLDRRILPVPTKTAKPPAVETPTE